MLIDMWMKSVVFQIGLNNCAIDLHLLINYLRDRVRLIIKDSKRYVKEEFLTAKDVVEALK